MKRVQISEQEYTDLRIASVHKDQNGIIIITMKDCGIVDEYDVMDLNLVIRHKAEQKAALKLLIATGNWDMSKKAKEMAEKEDNISKTKARAIVVSNSIKTSLYNFMLKFNEKSYAQQFFNSKDEAYNWLMSFKEKA